MKLLETLTTTQKVELLNGSSVGIFQTLILETDPFYSSKYPMCLGYYFQRSGEKTISPAYEKLITLTQEQAIADSAEQLIADVIRGKFLDKWNRVYQALITEQYNPLLSYEETERKTGDNSDTKTYDTQVVDDGNTNTNLRTVTDDENADNVYGFNSSTPVGNTTDNGQTVEVVTGSSDENTSHNTETKTGTEGITQRIDETKTRQGRNEVGADLIERELNLRNTQLFYDIVYGDIDSVATLQIYL